MFYSWSWWDLIPLPFLILAIRAMYFRRKVGEVLSKEGAGYMVLFSLTSLVLDVFRHRNGYAVLDAGAVAWWLYFWWNLGGGDGIKKFIQSLAPKPAYAVR